MRDPVRIGPYELLARLGQGGMGTVYQARHIHLKRTVALKVLAPGRTDHRAIARFFQEMESAGKFNHPNLVRATDGGESDGRHFLVMDLVDGVDLGRIVRDLGPLTIPDACEVARRAADGLQCVHEHGLVHRDIKPSNLMLGLDGAVTVLDLGLARPSAAARSGGSLTSLGEVMGTVDYMAPEQGLNAHGVDIRADLYSLGCTLYKLLSGRAPFGGPEYETDFKKLMAHAGASVPPIRDLRPEIPEALAALLDRLLAKAAADRPATPAEVAADLAPFAHGANLPFLAARARAEAETVPAVAVSDPLAAAFSDRFAPAATTSGARPREDAFATTVALYPPGESPVNPAHARAPGSDFPPPSKPAMPADREDFAVRADRGSIHRRSRAPLLGVGVISAILIVVVVRIPSPTPTPLTLQSQPQPQPQPPSRAQGPPPLPHDPPRPQPPLVRPEPAPPPPGPAPGVKFDLLSRPPTVIRWPAPPSHSQWRLDETERALWVASDNHALLALGESPADGRRYTVEVSVHQFPWVGGMGIFFGGHKVQVHGKPCFRYQQVEIESFRDQQGLEMFVLRRRAVNYILELGIPDTQMLPATPILAPTPTEHRLSITVGPDGLRAVGWDDQKFPDLLKRMVDDGLEPEDFHGIFGVVNWQGSSIFRNATYHYTPPQRQERERGKPGR